MELMKKPLDLSNKLQTLNYSGSEKTVIEGYLQPIRNMNKEDIVKSVGAMIVLCAKMYCGMQEGKMIPETIQEGVRLVYKHYKNMGVSEIREAFSLAAANQFEGLNMTAYFGTFTVSMLGDILTAYNLYRNPIIAKNIKRVYDAELNAQKENEKELKNNEARQKIYTDIENEIILVQSGEQGSWESWHDVPVHYAEIAVKQGWIEVSPEFKLSIWERAKKLALDELKNVSQDLTNFSEAKRARITLKNSVESQIIKDPAKRIYSKLLIFEYVKMHEI